MATKKNYTRLKHIAEQLFVEQGLTLSEISEQLDVSPNTLTSWKSNGNWEDAKDYFQNAPHRITKKLNELLEQILDGKNQKGEALSSKEISDMTMKSDAISKIKPALALLEKDVNPSIIYSVMIRLDNFSAQHYPDLAVKNLSLHRAFLQAIVNEHG